jgi:hypothetical protein
MRNYSAFNFGKNIILCFSKKCVWQPFAHATGKLPVLFPKKGGALHFDPSAHNVQEHRNVTERGGMVNKNEGSDSLARLQIIWPMTFKWHKNLTSLSPFHDQFLCKVSPIREPALIQIWASRKVINYENKNLAGTGCRGGFNEFGFGAEHAIPARTSGRIARR